MQRVIFVRLPFVVRWERALSAKCQLILPPGLERRFLDAKRRDNHAACPSKNDLLP